MTKRAKVKKYSYEICKIIYFCGNHKIIKVALMGRILLEDMEFYAYHGCFQEEQVIGNRFMVNLEFEFDTQESELSDKLSKTVNYQDVYGIIDAQMQQKSYLLEHVGRRIIDEVFQKFEMITFVKIKISKMNPPVGGKTKAVSVVLEKYRGK